MEADFTRFYQLDLRQLCWGPAPWSVRRLLAHVRHLPADSATALAVRGEQAFWTWETELAAATFDSLQRLQYYYLTANGAKPKEPKPFPRPGREHVQSEPTVGLAAMTQFIREGG